MVKIKEKDRLNLMDIEIKTVLKMKKVDLQTVLKF